MADYKNPGRSYGLKFLYPEKGVRKHSELVFMIAPAAKEAFEKHVTNPDLLKTFKLQEYFEREVTLAYDEPTARRPNPKFGFDKCGYRVLGDEIELHFPIVRGQGRAIAMTIAVLFGFHSPFYPGHEFSSNTPQLFSIKPFIRVGEWHYGHPLGGEIYPPVRKWLASRTLIERVEMGVVMSVAMRQVWRSIAMKDLRRYASDCLGSIEFDGRIFMKCFGDACDLATYPDMDFGVDTDIPTDFSCHNLDQAEQQVTMLCGLAALHEFLEANMNT